MKSARFLVGIDLGTTNTVVAYVDVSNGLEQAQTKLFEIDQLVGPGKVAKKPLLPSFRYHPAKGELLEQDIQLPWCNSEEGGLADELVPVIIGSWARELGSKVDGRLVSSAKSWLSHSQVDRHAPILPWGGAEGVDKVSPVLASASYLNYVRRAWNHDFPDALLEQQEIVITVPASFDEAARALTLEAAELAKLTNIRLLEEPQAVCYDWYVQHKEQAKSLLQNIHLLLVCDVGGGTTDLSLIRVSINNGELALTRIGVGDHLMLGGDNVDLALAHIAEKRIVQDEKKLNTASLSQLIQQTRHAKELLLSEHAPELARITVLGSGARLIGGARSCNLSQEEVRRIALDGFFPESSFSEFPARRRSAVVEFGLPYAADPAVSKHIAEFLARHESICREALQLNDVHSPAIPDAVLFNGGVFNSTTFTERALSVLSAWRHAPVHSLENTHPDLAVAYGAVAYGLARRGAHLRIGGGAARSYFLLIDSDEAQAKGVCLLPKGTEEDQAIHLVERKFLLRLGQPVVFHLASSTEDTVYRPGDLSNLDSEHFLRLPPLVVVLGEEFSNQSETDVELVATLTEVGTLKIECVSTAADERRWNVEFQLRKSSDGHEQRLECIPAILRPKFNEAKSLIEEVYGQGKKHIQPNIVKELRSHLEKLLGKRDSWDIPILRALFDILMENANKRRRSASHERIWFNLAGYTLRPGFGVSLDNWRVQQIWSFYQQGLQFNNEAQVWSDWWTCWRRCAGGLNEGQQYQLYESIAAYIDPGVSRKRRSNDPIVKSYDDMVRLVGTLENLSVELKVKLMQWLLKRLEKSSETPASWWALGRVGSRVPFHGSTHNVVPKEIVQNCLSQLLKLDWKNNQHLAFAAVMMARMSGDRDRDLDDEYRSSMLQKLQSIKAPAIWLEMISTVKALDEFEIKRIFGEALPSGLKLID